MYEIIHSGDVFRFLHREVPFRPENVQVDLNVPSVWKKTMDEAPPEKIFRSNLNIFRST